MAIYNVSVIVDGWIRVKMEAATKRDAKSAVSSAKVRIDLVDASGEKIGEITDGLFTETIEGVEDCKVSISEDNYYSRPDEQP